MKSHLSQSTLSFFPPLDGGFFGLTLMAFLGYVGLSWWSKYSSDGGGVIVQRMSSCKDERQSLFATLYFNVANYCLRTWPWILAALASMVLYPVVKDPESVYPQMMVDLLPSGLKGLMLASFFAAFMSSLSTYLNLSSAYFVNDFYRPFLRKDASERHYINVSRLATLALSVLTGFIAYHTTSIIGVFTFLIAFGSGTGLVYITRWFWWRVNAWSELSAMTASTLCTVIVYLHPPLKSLPYYGKLSIIILVSTVVWISVTVLTRPADRATLLQFYKKTKAGGPGWRPIEMLANDPRQGNPLQDSVRAWANGCIFIIGLTIGTGKLILGYPFSGCLWLSIAAVSGWFIYRGLAGMKKVLE